MDKVKKYLVTYKYTMAGAVYVYARSKKEAEELMIVSDEFGECEEMVGKVEMMKAKLLIQ